MVNMLLLQPNVEQTLVLLERCSNIKELRQIHGQILKKGTIMQEITLSRLLDSYASIEFGNLACARLLFDRISSPNTVMWNSMIRAFSNSNEPEAALFLYHQMLHNSVPHNSYTFPFLLKACSALSAYEETQQIHAQIIKRGYGIEVYATNSLLRVYATSGDIKSAQILFNRLATRDIVSWNTVIDGYIKCGNLDVAYEMFQAMPVKNVISWTAMIVGFVRTGMHKEALSLLQQMLVAGIKPDRITLSSSVSACAGIGALEQGRWIHTQMQKSGIKPTSITFTAILTACSHAGLVEEGKSMFHSISTVYNMKPSAEHYGCMVDLLGRAGLLIEAKEFIESMPIKPNAAIWGALLNACYLHKHVELGKEIGKVLVELDPDHSGRYIHLASILAADGEWNQAVEVRNQIKHKGLLNSPGCSSITLNGVVHEFFAGTGSSYPNIQEIYDMPNLIAK